MSGFCSIILLYFLERLLLFSRLVLLLPVSPVDLTAVITCMTAALPSVAPQLQGAMAEGTKTLNPKP